MKKSMVIGATFFVLVIAGCSADPAAAPGPAGPQGETGPQGAAGQDANQSRDRDRGHDGDNDRDKDRDRQTHAGPCPAGEHRFTNNNTGEVICVRD